MPNTTNAIRLSIQRGAVLIFIIADIASAAERAAGSIIIKPKIANNLSFFRIKNMSVGMDTRPQELQL